VTQSFKLGEGADMSGKGIDFLEDWVRRNITDDVRYGDRFAAKSLADRCLADAAKAGVTIDDMDPEQGSVETVIYEAMQNYFGAEAEFWNKFAVTPLYY
jgi:hypothetical protein